MFALRANPAFDRLGGGHAHARLLRVDVTSAVLGGTPRVEADQNLHQARDAVRLAGGTK